MPEEQIEKDKLKCRNKTINPSIINLINQSSDLKIKPPIHRAS